jgi:hypothetical protein
MTHVKKLQAALFQNATGAQPPYDTNFTEALGAAGARQHIRVCHRSSLQHVCLPSRATIRSTPERETSAFECAHIAILRVRHYLSCNIVIADMRTHGM